MDKKNIKYLIYAIVGIIIIYVLYLLYQKYYSNESSSSSTNSFPNTTATNNVGYGSILSPLNFNTTDAQAGILASYNSFVNDNVGNATNSNLQNEYLNASSFTSSNPLFTATANSNVFNATNVATNTNMQLPGMPSLSYMSGNSLETNQNAEANINDVTVSSQQMANTNMIPFTEIALPLLENVSTGYNINTDNGQLNINASKKALPPIFQLIK